MDVIVLLGAGAEPAQSIARRLVSQGARVHGLAHKFPEQGFSHRDFIPVGVNPADPVAVREAVEAIVKREGGVGAVILAGHTPVEDAFEAAHPHDVALAVFAGLAAPLAAVRAAMPGLVRRRGMVMAITRPVFGPGAALGGVVEAGLSAFCEGLFSELRDTGVRVCHLRLQENPGSGDPAARFSPAPQSRIQPDIVADTVETVMRLRENNAVTRLVLRPQATREEPRLPVTAEPRLAALQMVRLPLSRDYPPPEDKILTPEYRRPDYAPPPEAEEREEDEDDDDAVDPELAYLIKPRHRDRFVRETPSHDDRGESEQPEGEWSDAEESPPPAARREERAERRDYDPRRPHLSASPHAPRDNRPPKNGALRIQPPHRAGDAESRPLSRGPQPGPAGGDGRPSRPYEQMPRPKGWQGPRLPQVQHMQGGNARPENRPPHAERRPAAPANRDGSRDAGTPQEAPAPVENTPPEPAAPVVREKPSVPIPVIVAHESKASSESGDKSGSGRSEAVTLKLAPPAAPAPQEAASVEEPSEIVSGSEAKPRRKAPAKKPAKAAPAEPVGEASASEVAPKPRRGRPPKKPAAS